MQAQDVIGAPGDPPIGNGLTNTSDRIVARLERLPLTSYQHGIFANPVVPPATPPGKGLIRTSYMATHEDRDVDDVLEVFALLAAERQAVTAGGTNPR